MQAVLDLLRNNEPLTQQLRTATSVEDAAVLLADASEQRGERVSVSEITEWLARRPKVDAQALSDEELQTVSGGMMPGDGIKTTLETKLTECSHICCTTCRTTSIWG